MDENNKEENVTVTIKMPKSIRRNIMLVAASQGRCVSVEIRETLVKHYGAVSADVKVGA